MRTEWRLYQASEWEIGKRQYWPLLDPNADRQIDTWTILKIRSDARKAFINYGPLKTAVYEKARYAVGDAWMPQYQGSDMAFGKAATKWFTDVWSRTGNLIGPIRGWHDSLKLESRYLDVYGELFIYKVKDEDGLPRYQHIPPHRVDNPRNKQRATVKGRLINGPYAGKRCVYGIVINDYGAPVAYCVLGNEPEQDMFVPADQMIWLADWEFADQTRPISAIAHGILNVRDIMAIQANEKRALEIASSISILENNPIGGVDVNDPTQFIRQFPGIVGQAGQPVDGIQPPPFPGYQTGINLETQETAPSGTAGQPLTPYMWLDNGTWKYFKAGTGSDVKAFQFERPSGELKDFLDRLGRDAINFIWPFDLVSNPAGGSANNRTLWVRANSLTKERQNKLYAAAKQRLLYGIAVAMDLGILPESDDWMAWDFNFPRKPSIDAGRDAAADLNDIKMGVKSWSDIWGELGTDATTAAFRKALDVAEMLKAKKAIEQMLSEEFGEPVTIPDSYMFSLSPNPTTQTDAPGVDEGAQPAEPGPAGEPAIEEPALTEPVGDEGAGGEDPVEKEDSAEIRPRGRDLLGAQT
jgi:Phage portal protein, lambda family